MLSSCACTPTIRIRSPWRLPERWASGSAERLCDDSSRSPRPYGSAAMDCPGYFRQKQTAVCQRYTHITKDHLIGIPLKRHSSLGLRSPIWEARSCPDPKRRPGLGKARTAHATPNGCPSRQFVPDQEEQSRLDARAGGNDDPVADGVCVLDHGYHGCLHSARYLRLKLGLNAGPWRQFQSCRAIVFRIDSRR
jgi:hypothetical protein